MDCSTDISPICDNSTNTCDNQSSDSNSALVNITVPSSAEVSAATSNSNIAEPRSVLVDIPETPAETIANPLNVNLLDDAVVDSSPNILSVVPEVLVDISESSYSNVSSNNTGPLSESPVTNNLQQIETISDSIQTGFVPSSDTLIDMPQIMADSAISNLQTVNHELLSSTSNLSSADTEIDDGELMERSSPPPSYEDVTLEGENVGAFGLAYGTI